MSTSAQRRELQEAVNRERARCATLLEKARHQLAATLEAAAAPPKAQGWTWLVLTDYLDRIRRPFLVRKAQPRPAVPGRRRRCCGLCGGDDHLAPRCPDRQPDGAPA